MVQIYFTAQSFSKYGVLQESIFRFHLPITPIKNEWLLRVHVWIFGKIGVEKRFGQKTACLDMATFLPDFGQKITGFEIWKRFGGGLEHPNIW